jgi:hypothetical protein
LQAPTTGADVTDLSKSPSRDEIKKALERTTNAILHPSTPPVVAVDLGMVARFLQSLLESSYDG